MMELFKKTLKLTKNLYTNKFNFLYIKRCVSPKRVRKKKLLGYHNKDINFKIAFAKSLFNYFYNAEAATVEVL